MNRPGPVRLVRVALFLFLKKMVVANKKEHALANLEQNLTFFLKQQHIFSQNLSSLYVE